ncbi:MAG: PLP-dependent aminotransferase family protein [Pseudomonadota bacterium]
MKSQLGTELLIPIDRNSDVPLHVQLERQLRTSVRIGRLTAHMLLPSTRSLAHDLGVSRGVVVEAYEQLTAEGYFTATAGSGTRVAPIGAEASHAPVAEPAPSHPCRYDFQPGSPDPHAFPRRAWLACLRRTIGSAASDVFRYPDPRGAPAARAAVAAFLGRSRATVGHAGNVVMCNGFAQGIDLVARLLKERGVTDVACEDPGYGAVPRRLRELGIAAHPIPVDSRGMQIEPLQRSGASAVVVTPAHQYPTGAGMTADRRAALLAWAAANDALVIEDDYDSEYRYDREPLGALQGLAPERVIYIGTASKNLSPALRLGWLMAPQRLVEGFGQLKQRMDGGSPTLEQLAFAEFLNTGEMERHLRRMRPVYRLRRDLLVAALHEHLPGLRIGGVAAGLHLMLDLPPGTDERALLRTAQAHSMRFFCAGDCWSVPRPDRPALVLGYGCCHESSIRAGVQVLARLVREHAAALAVPA